MLLYDRYTAELATLGSEKRFTNREKLRLSRLKEELNDKENASRDRERAINVEKAEQDKLIAKKNKNLERREQAIVARGENWNSYKAVGRCGEKIVLRLDIFFYIG